MAIFYYSRRGDTAPLTDTLQNNLGIAVNLTGATIRFHAMDRLGVTLVNALATGPGGGALDVTGQVRYAVVAADVVNALTAFVEWQVTFGDGTIQTWPQNDNGIWIIYPDLA